MARHFIFCNSNIACNEMRDKENERTSHSVFYLCILENAQNTLFIWKFCAFLPLAYSKICGETVLVIALNEKVTYFATKLILSGFLLFSMGHMKWWNTYSPAFLCTHTFLSPFYFAASHFLCMIVTSYTEHTVWINVVSSIMH